MGDKNEKKMPNYFNQLTEEEKKEYLELRQRLSMPGCKNRRNKSNETFMDIIKTIKKFVNGNSEREIERSLVCGIVWLDNGIAINTHQLSLITNKCKSSINGSFQALGYGTTPTGTESSTELIAKFSFMKKNFGELRQWTVRKKLCDNQSAPLKLTDLVKKRIGGEEDMTAPEEQCKPQQETEFCLVNFVQDLINKRGKKADTDHVKTEKVEDSMNPLNLNFTNENSSIFDDKFVFSQNESADLDSIDLEYLNLHM